MPWLGETDRIDIVFLPGILCRLSGCRDPVLRLNYRVAARCKGDARNCKDPEMAAYRDIARSNFRRP